MNSLAANATTIVHTLTGNSTTTASSSGSFSMPVLFGIPADLLVIMFVIIAVMTTIISRRLGGGGGTIEVVVTWVFKNYSAIRLKASEDLRGIFIEVKNARGKSIETVKKDGVAIEVKEIDRKRMKAYLLEKPRKGTEDNLVYLLMKEGRFKLSREYITVEGTGQTIDFIERAKGTDDSGNAPVIQEEKSAAKQFLQMLAEAALNSLSRILLPMGTGLGLGIGITVLLLVLFGHLK